MAKRISRIIFFLLLFVTPTVPYAWGEVRQVTIIYSNTINAQIFPVG